jgi:hypothetical protein
VIVGGTDEPLDARGVPAGLPADASLRRVPLASNDELLVLMVPMQDRHGENGTSESALLVEIITAWAAEAAPQNGPSPSVVSVPLYGCHVVWTPGRAAVAGPLPRLELLVTAVSDFASREGELRQLEQRCTDLVVAVEGDAAHAFEFGERSVGQRDVLAARFREAVAVRGRLAVLAPAVHAPPLHPPTLASQLGERLRDRTRLAERHEFAVDRAELAERLYEACGQRISEFGIARRQLALEWAIVVLLVIQTALLVVDLLSRGTAT